MRSIRAGYSDMALLDIRGLKTHFRTDDGWVHAVDGVDLRVDAGETVCLVGESGSGKSVTAMSILKLVPMPPGRLVAGQVLWDGRDLVPLPSREMEKLRGREIGVVFQEPMTALNPVYTVGDQIAEGLRLHEGLSRAAALDRAAELLALVHIPQATRRVRDYPHQFSGGMRQRVMIALALACKPRLLIADEPTTALDVTIQAQILDLLLSLKRERRMALVLITHDLGLVAEHADRVVVQYAGRQVESSDAAPLFADPHHPYTAALLAALPERATARRLEAIPGVVPGQFNRPAGCLFAPRCAFADVRCRTTPPAHASAELGLALCHYPLRSGIPMRVVVEATA